MLYRLLSDLGCMPTPKGKVPKVCFRRRERSVLKIVGVRHALFHTFEFKVNRHAGLILHGFHYVIMKGYEHAVWLWGHEIFRGILKSQSLLSSTKALVKSMKVMRTCFC